MSTSGIARGHVRVWLLIATCMAMLTVAAPSHAATSNSFYFHTNNALVQRDGVPYKASLWGFKSTEGVHLSVQLTRVHDPEGVRYTQQMTSFDFSLPSKALTIRKNLAGATLDTGDHLASFGRIRLVMEASEKATTRCKGHLVSRKQAIGKGSMSFTTRRQPWGKVTEAPTKASLTRDDGQCDGGGATFPCPPSGVAFNAYGYGKKRDLSIWASRASKATHAEVMTWATTYLRDATVTHYTEVRLPADRFEVAGDRSTATLRGMKKTFIRGKATFTASQPDGVYHDTCGKNRTLTTRTRYGIVEGNFTVLHDGFEPRSMDQFGNRLDGYVDRQVVRAS
jgi:hypothetical protein